MNIQDVNLQVKEEIKNNIFSNYCRNVKLNLLYFQVLDKREETNFTHVGQHTIPKSEIRS